MAQTMNDTIRRQAAIDALGKRPHLWTGGDYELARLIQYDLDKSAIENVPSAQQWIPVTERLPEEKTYVLILADTIAGKMIKVSFIYKDSAGRNCWATLDEYGKNLFDLQPTHWMPLPEPWKGESDG